jgi:hypothetical protein
MDGAAGVATLAHELIENFEAQAIPAADFDEAFERSHPRALAAEDSLLAELQQSAGERPSGGRLNTYVVDRTTAAERRAGTSRTSHVEAHRSDFVVHELTTARGKDEMKVSRRASVALGTTRVGGFTTRSTARPTGAAAVLRPITDLLSAQPTASVTLKPTARQGLLPAGALWAAVAMEHLRELMADDAILRSERRFQHDAPTVGSANEVEVIVRRPDLP